MKLKFILPFAVLLSALLMLLPASAYDSSLPRVVDKTRTLSEYEIDELNDMSGDFRREYSMDCVIMLINSLGGKSAMAYADDAYDEGGYGMGNDNSGILILISVGDREVYISTCGKAIEKIDDYEIELILDDMMNSLSQSEWADAFSHGIFAAEEMIERQNSGGSVSRDDSSSTGNRLLVTFFAPAVIAGISVGVMYYMMNNARGKYSAADYAVRGSFALTGALDIFLSRHVSKTPRASESSGGGGGSSHTSSGGVSHGGGGRSF